MKIRAKLVPIKNIKDCKKLRNNEACENLPLENVIKFHIQEGKLAKTAQLCCCSTFFSFLFCIAAMLAAQV